MIDRTTAEKVDAEGGFDTYQAEYRITFSVPHGTENPERDVYRTVTGMSTARAWDEGGYLLDEKGGDFPDIYFN